MEVLNEDDIDELIAERKQRRIDYRAGRKEETSAYNKEYNKENVGKRQELKRKWNEDNREHVNEYARDKAEEARVSGKFPCQDCGSCFGNPRELQRHIDSEVACKPKRDAARTARLTCGGCGKVFSQMANLERHIDTGVCPATRSADDMICRYCSRVFSNKGNRARHENACKSK